MTKKELWRKYFKLLEVTNDIKLSSKEVKVLTYCLLQPSLSMENFSGKGRKDMLEETNLASTTLSATLSSLVKKNLLVKKDRGSYDLILPLKGIKGTVDNSGGIDIKYRLTWSK